MSLFGINLALKKKKKLFLFSNFNGIVKFKQDLFTLLIREKLT